MGNCCCGGNAGTRENGTFKNSGKIESIKVLGGGCKNCEKLHQNVIDAVAEMGIATNVEYITDMAVVMSYNVMSTPIVVVNEQVASAGKVLSVGQIKEMLANV